jgi:hypothetical protein
LYEQKLNLHKKGENKMENLEKIISDFPSMNFTHEEKNLIASENFGNLVFFVSTFRKYAKISLFSLSLKENDIYESVMVEKQNYDEMKNSLNELIEKAKRISPKSFK